MSMTCFFLLLLHTSNQKEEGGKAYQWMVKFKGNESVDTHTHTHFLIEMNMVMTVEFTLRKTNALPMYNLYHVILKLVDIKKKQEIKHLSNRWQN